MDKAIKLHKQYVLDKIEQFEDSKNTDSNKHAIGELYRYHLTKMRDFQHERLVHLLVMLFFGGLMLLLFVAVVVLSSVVVLSLSAIDPSRILLVLSTTLAGLLLVTELFYVAHYYKLENGVQGLYAVTEKLHQMVIESK